MTTNTPAGSPGQGPQAIPSALLLLRGVEEHRQGRLDRAEQLYRLALRANPRYVEAWRNLGSLMRERGVTDLALLFLRRAIALEPEAPATWSNLGNALAAAGQMDAALEAHRKAVALAPGVALSHYNLGLQLGDMGLLEECLHHLEAAEKLGYSQAGARWERALNLLRHGRLEEGFRDYEWRWQTGKLKRPHTDIPLWNGQPLKKGCLLVRSEQGFGDILQFIRYLPMVRERAPEVAFMARPEIARLLAASPCAAGVNICLPGDRMEGISRAVDLLSLPRLMQTRLDSIPADIPYLAAPGTDVATLTPAERRDGKLRVGIFWQGKTHMRNSARRSVTLELFRPLLDIPDTAFFSLQVDGQRQRIAELGLQDRLIDLGGRIRDFADTAALMREMDLVVTVDSATAHLAGGLGRPVWVALSMPFDWRWMMGKREDSPWYPGMMLFRQTRPLDWESVFARLETALRRYAAARRDRRGD